MLWHGRGHSAPEPEGRAWGLTGAAPQGPREELTVPDERGLSTQGHSKDSGGRPEGEGHPEGVTYPALVLSLFPQPQDQV